MSYLTEKNLGKILKEILPKHHFIHDKCVPNSNSRKRPDYRNEKLKLIIEFDGHSHYCQSKTILNDIKKDNCYRNLGYSIHRIPYFIQITEQVLQLLFNKKIKFEQKYPNGFIDSKAILPSDFCELGIQKFKKDLDKFHFHENEIINSLKEKIKVLDDERLVLPKSLIYLIKKGDGIKPSPSIIT